MCTQNWKRFKYLIKAENQSFRIYFIRILSLEESLLGCAILLDFFYILFGRLLRYCVELKTIPKGRRSEYGGIALVKFSQLYLLSLYAMPSLIFLPLCKIKYRALTIQIVALLHQRT